MRTRRIFTLCFVLLTASIAGAPAGAEVPAALVTEIRPTIELGLASEEVAVHAWAVRAVAPLADEVMLEALAAELANTNVPVRLAAILAMVEADFDTETALTQLAAEVVTGDAATRALVLKSVFQSLSEQQRVAVIEAILDEATDEGVVRDVARWLARYSSGAVYAMLEEIDEMSPSNRAVFASEVRLAGRPDGVVAAQALLASRDAAARAEGAEIAFALNTVEARNALSELIDGDDAGLAQRAGLHLARYGNPAGLALAGDLVRNTAMDEALRIDAMALLRDQGPSIIAFTELQALATEEGRSAAFVTRVHELMGATRDSAAVAYLQGRFDALFADERLDGISGLGFTGDVGFVAELGELARGNAELALRSRAITALGHIGGDEAAQILIDALLMERSDEIRVALIDALAMTGSTLATQPIANEFSRQSPATAAAALRALRSIGDSSMAPQIENVALAFRDPAVRWQATVTLSHIDAAAGRIRLLQALDRAPEGFLTDLEGLPQDLLDEVDVTLLRHSDPTTREMALLRVITRPDGGYAVLRAMLEGQAAPEVRREAIAVVTAARRVEDAELYNQLTNDTDRTVRVQGMAALAELADPGQEEFFRGYLNHADVALRMVAAYAVLRIHAGDAPVED